MYKNAKSADFKFVHWFTAYYCKKNPLCVISYFYVIKLVFPHLFLWFNNQYRTVYRVTVYYVRLFDFFAFEIALWSSGMSLASGAKSPLFEPHI